MKSVFMGIENVNVANESQRQYFMPGNYRVQVENVLIHNKRLGGALFIVETNVLESDNPAIRPGDRRNWVQPMETDAAMPRVKCFLGAANGYNPRRQLDEINETITLEQCERAVSNENPHKGVVLLLECFNKQSKRTGKDFTIHLWSPIEERAAIQKN